jgi:hypothetical protein
MINWNAVGAAATAGATIVALIIPFVMNHLSDIDRRKERRRKKADICLAVDQMALLYIEFRNLLPSAQASQKTTRYQQIALESRAIASALDRMLTSSDVGDGSLVAGPAARELGIGFSSLAERAGNGEALGSITVSLIPFEQLAHLASSRAERVREYSKIDRLPGNEKPKY